MRDRIAIAVTFEEVGRFLDDMDKNGLPSLDTDPATDMIIHMLADQYKANRPVGAPPMPARCEEGKRKPCAHYPQWRVREKNDTARRNWIWAGSRHLSSACTGFGEGVELDVIRVGA